MKIAFFTDVLFPPDGGIEQHVLTTSQALARRGNEVRVYHPGPLLGKFQDPNLKLQTNRAKLQIPNNNPQMIGNCGLEFVACRGLNAAVIWPNFRFSFPLHLYFSFKKWRPDIIHFHTSGPMALAAITLAKLINAGPRHTSTLRSIELKDTGSYLKESPCKGDSFRDSRPMLVGTFHSYLMEKEYLQNFQFSIFNFQITFGWLSPLLWSYVRFIFNRCDAVVSPSEWVARDIKDHGIHKPVKVVHNGADLAEFGGRASGAAIKLIRDKYNLGENVLLYVGRLSREKGLDALLKAVSVLSVRGVDGACRSPLPSDGIVRQPADCCRSTGDPPRTPPVHHRQSFKLLLVGDGPAEGELKKLAGDLGILDNVVFVGRVEHKDLPGSGLFEVSKAFVTASASENQPLTIIEAMAKGLPIIGVRARGVTELVNGNGLLAVPSDEKDLANKIYQLLSDENLRVKMGEESRKKSENYSLSKAAENLENLYREVRNKK